MSIPNLIPYKTLYISDYICSCYAFVFIFEFSIHVSKHILQFHSLDKAFLRYLPCPVVSGHEGCKGGKNQMGAYLDSPFRRCCPLLFQLVAAQPARTVNGTHRLLYIHSCRRLSLPACRRCMDLPPSQTGPYGRCVQQREREFHAGNKAYRKRIFCKSADTVLLWQEMEQRLDQCRESFPCLHRTGNARFGKVFCSGKFLYQSATRSCVNNCSKF